MKVIICKIKNTINIKITKRKSPNLEKELYLVFCTENGSILLFVKFNEFKKIIKENTKNIFAIIAVISATNERQTETIKYVGINKKTITKIITPTQNDFPFLMGSDL